MSPAFKKWSQAGCSYIVTLHLKFLVLRKSSSISSLLVSPAVWLKVVLVLGLSPHP